MASDEIVVRTLRESDLEQMVALDARLVGRRREQYLRLKVAQALEDTGVQVSLAADVDGRFAGFLLARVYYGEFGAAEPVAMLDTLGVHPEHRGEGVGRALLRQLRMQLHALGVKVLETEVAWNDQRLLSFFQHVGFVPAARLCLDLDLEEARRREETAEGER